MRTGKKAEADEFLPFEGEGGGKRIYTGIWSFYILIWILAPLQVRGDQRLAYRQVAKTKTVTSSQDKVKSRNSRTGNSSHVKKQ